MEKPPARDTTPLRTRKEPQQARSRDLVAAITEATARIVRDHGTAGLTVEAICRVAGVAPGSFYQYFPHREAVLFRLLRAHAEEVTSTMLDVLSQLAADPIEAVVHGAVSAFCDLHARDPALHAALGRVVATVAGPGLEDDLLGGATVALGRLLDGRRDELGGQDPSIVAFLLLRGLEGMVHAAARDRPALLAEPGFRAGLERMLLAAAHRP